MKWWVTLFLAITFLTSCSLDDDSFSIRSTRVESNVDESHEGLLLIHAKGGFVTLGTKLSSSRYTERPKMGVRFDYDFSIGKHEVTHDEFSSYATDSWGSFSKAELKNRPVTDVTYYDVVLYANARSKAEGYDTAYTYTSVVMDEDAHCVKMENLVFNPDVDAYRLPTEAEWMLVATQEWDVEKAWTMENSMNHIHDVCTKGESRLGICDIAGNALEWVNDWLGIYKDTVVYNYAGNPDGALNGERVVKGGSYITQKENVNYYSRGDVYSVTSASRAVYVGFRIAFGRIPDAVWLSNDGISVENRLIPKIAVNKVRSLVGTIRSKLVFRNDMTGNLAFVDYSYAPHMVFEIQDTLNCFHPDISPDGSKIAFSTGSEGISGESFVYVRSLTVSGDSLIKLDVKNASIPRWRVLPDGSTVIVYVTDSGNNTDESKFKTQSTWQVPFSENKFGTPVKLFDGAYHGGISYDNQLAVSGARLLRARIADSAGTVEDGSALDTVWYDGRQACNVSLSPDSSKRTLFLDFGDKVGQTFVGQNYGVHERILIADSTGKLIGSVGAPKGYSFDHSEWALGGYHKLRTDKQNLIVATLANNNGAHSKIVLVNLLDSTVTDLVEGEEIWHPTFWVEKGSLIEDEKVFALNSDSAAIYFEGPDATLLSSKMNVFWYKCDYLKVVALGSSRMSMGFVANDISYGAAFNMATIPSDMDVSHYVAMNYILDHSKKLKFLIVGVDLDLWGESENYNIKKNLQSIPGYYYDRSHNFWKDEGHEAMKTLSKYFVRENSHLRFISQKMGWIEYDEVCSWNEGHFGYMALVADSNWSNSDVFVETAFKKLTEIVEKAKEKDVVVLGVIFPQSPYFKKTGAFGRHGMRRSHAIMAIDRLRHMEKDYSNFVLMDENKMGDHDYPDSLAYDYDHLNAHGGHVITARIDSVLHAIGGK